MEEDLTIAEIAAGDPNYSILVSALDAAGLVDAVADPGADLTVFAPDNAAFATLAAELGYEGDPEDTDAVFGFIADALASLDPNGDPIPLLTEILLYHVSPGAKTSETVLAADTVATLQSDGATISPSGDGRLIDLEPDLLDPSIEAADIMAVNGTIQGIDRVLLPLDVPGNDAPSIADIATGSDDFSILVTALDAAGLVDVVADPDAEFTVFAPTNAAFAALATDLGFEGDTGDNDAVFGFIADTLASLDPDGDPIPLLTEILLYHVSPSALSSEQVLGAESIPTLASGGQAIEPGEGATLVDLEPDLADPDIVTTDVGASNGTVHVIDRVLLPLDVPGNETTTIADAAAGNEDFSILVSALDAAGLVDAVADPEADLTVFAPTNAAFASLATDLGYDGDTEDPDAVFGFIADTLASLDPNGDPIPLLTDILLYHVSDGARTSEEILAADEVTTLASDGQVITPSDDGRLVDLEPDLLDPEIAIADIETDNGTIQAIDRVLLPLDIEAVDNPTIAEIAAGNDDFSILVSALDAAGLVDVVADPDAEFTVFAPTNAAFATLATDLGFEGDPEDPDAVFGFIADTLASLDPNGDPIPLLTDILLYHVSPGAQSIAEVEAADQVATALEGAFLVGSEDAGLFDIDPDRANAQAIEGLTDIGAANGTVQAIDRVLLPLDLPDDAPEETIADVVAASGEFDDNGGDFDILLAALDAAGLVGAFTDPEDSFTVFAPTDAAFLDLAALFGSEAESEEQAFADIANALAGFTDDGNPIPLLTDVLTYHVAEGAFSRAELAAGPDLTTLFGVAPATDGATLEDGAAALPDPAFIDAASDIVTANGIIQAIDGVLLPVDLPGVGNLSGTEGDDTFEIGVATLSVDGGEGEDTAVFDNPVAETSFEPVEGGFAATTDGNTVDLFGVETFQFTDATVVAEESEAAAQAFRLYGAALGRDPDLGGITFWTDTIEAVGLAPVADEFVTAPEFDARFGESTDATAFVNALYDEVLGREADDGGLAFWLGELDRPDFDESDLLVAFSESDEYKDGTANETDDGVLLLA